ncbi:2-amino-4-hydroxy-6-hydroxymethyldihydropteridine diphosphokinase [Rhizobium paknamense]|uniref:2-amino-4-hydroxy-6-hydroxymethyldihydropteridine pyrophosphokinase n=1 Tax=Rhizobium paknamense TaxID=1206817 RepID=A0ABU0I662_9HYPH|nr:2-amino-4-hydroxy-6-hydroxymethyldihydropteridine diphosphokinase [Rhizobium paknamense]MDQ0453715.1 2-amino-4-hydroxy-6-hydroxymethyldihydropteridine diphosphokinase [Rhizobium paknamense]
MTTCADPLPVVAALGLGGNLGDPVEAMARALQALDRREDSAMLAVSGLYRTPPWGKTDQADFFNACALVKTTLSPSDLLDCCLDLERAMKRVRLERWGPRTLDIDILFYGDRVVAEDHLHIPHPRMLERAFVLKPLADIAPDHVIAEKAISEWLGTVDASDINLADGSAGWWRR